MNQVFDYSFAEWVFWLPIFSKDFHFLRLMSNHYRELREQDHDKFDLRKLRAQYYSDRTDLDKFANIFDSFGHEYAFQKADYSRYSIHLHVPHLEVWTREDGLIYERSLKLPDCTYLTEGGMDNWVAFLTIKYLGNILKVYDAIALLKRPIFGEVRRKMPGEFVGVHLPKEEEGEESQAAGQEGTSEAAAAAKKDKEVEKEETRKASHWRDQVDFWFPY